MKMHLNFVTTDLIASVDFYRVLLDAHPVKVLADYALFVTEQPGLELALDLGGEVLPTTDAHYGLCVVTVDKVEAAIARLTAAGYVASIEREQTCCYANQSKVWTVDPEGRRWEVYTVHEDTIERDHPETTCCGNASDETRSCCAA